MLSQSKRMLPVAALLTLGAISLDSASAALFSYNNRAVFNLAAPGLSVEDFEEADVADGDLNGFPSVLNSASDNDVFSPGDILPGLTVTDNPDSGGNELIAVGDNGVGINPSKAVANNSFPDALDLIFSTGTSAVGFDLFTASGPGSAVASEVTVSVFDGADLFLESFEVETSATNGIFFGVVSDAGAIGRVSIRAVGSSRAEIVDNVAFERSEVPEPSTWTLLGMGLGLLGLRRRRR